LEVFMKRSWTKTLVVGVITALLGVGVPCQQANAMIPVGPGIWMFFSEGVAYFIEVGVVGGNGVAIIYPAGTTATGGGPMTVLVGGGGTATTGGGATAGGAVAGGTAAGTAAILAVAVVIAVAGTFAIDYVYHTSNGQPSTPEVVYDLIQEVGFWNAVKGIWNNL
jgi:hypothetical protein